MTPEDYVARMSKVEGWLHRDSALATIALSRAAEDLGVRDGSAEIGIHHGRLFILLHLLSPPSVAIDVFEEQTLNVDRSGRGNREIFLHNCRRFGDPDRISVIADSSENVSAEQILSKTGRVRLFSVDGGHTAHLTLNDLNLAQDCLADGGIVILDDYFNSRWPDVSVGVNRFLSRGALRPFAITPNKLFLTDTSEAADTYRMTIERLDGHIATMEMAGSRVAILAGGWKARFKARFGGTRLAEAVETNRFTRPLARVVRNLLS